MRDFLMRNMMAAAFAVIGVIGFVVVTLAADRWQNVPEQRLDCLVLGDCVGAQNKCAVKQAFTPCKDNPALQCLDENTLQCMTTDPPYYGSWSDAFCKAGAKNMFCNLFTMQLPVDKCTINGLKGQGFCPAGEKECEYDYLGPDEEGAPEVTVCTAGTGNICN